ncbi:MAG: hypothetical protein ABRQ35_05765 [Smithellaceae bacterium]
MVTIEFTQEEAAETRELLKAVIEPLEWSIARTELGHRAWRDFLKKRRAFIDELIKRLETNLTMELTDEETEESIAMLSEAIPVLERSIAKTDVGHREFRDFLKKRRALVDALLKRLQK